MSKAEDLRQQGNDCIKGGNFSEAVLHYSHAMKTEPLNHLLYSNRSLAFLKLQQYYLAEEDAKQVIKLQPKWPKGFYRKGEVEFHVGHYQSALLSYGQALLLEPGNNEVRQAVSRTNAHLVKQKIRAGREPWLFCGVGAVIGLLIVLTDQFLTAKPSVPNAILQVLLVITFSSLGYGVLMIYRYINESEARSLLEPPVDLLAEMGATADEDEDVVLGEAKPVPSKPNEAKHHRKGGVGAAHQRYKKGKT